MKAPENPSAARRARVHLDASCSSLAVGLRRPEPPEQDDRVRAVCGSCHLFPAPELLPRSVWRTQIEHMAFLTDSLPAGSPVFEFDVEGFVAWYESRAPERLLMERAITRAGPGPLRFDRRSIRLGRASGPGVATVGRVGRCSPCPTWRSAASISSRGRRARA